jgi:co-chaperonin GroES (HSP10)
MIHPQGYRVIVKPDDIETVTPAGVIVVTDEKLEKAGQMRGTLVAIGKDCWEGHEPYAKIGDWVLYSRYAGKVIEDPVTRERYFILNDEDILATIDREEA